MPKSNRPTISTHVLDTTRGEPAAGVSVLLFRLDAHDRSLLSTSETDADGRIADVGGPLAPGRYGLSFEVAAHYRKRGQSPFLERVTVDFEITDSERRYHIPLLMSPFSCTSYRGS